MTTLSEPARLLAAARVIAVVGMSATPGKHAHEVPVALVRAGWRVLPVNPRARSVLGLRCVPSLRDLHEDVDIVNVFRPAPEAAGVAADAAALGAAALWLQLGIRSAEARRVAEAAGMVYVEDLCIDVVRRRFGISPPAAPPAT